MSDIQARLEITLGQHSTERFNGGNGGYCRCGQYLYGGTLAAHQAETVRPLMGEVVRGARDYIDPPANFELMADGRADSKSAQFVGVMNEVHGWLDEYARKVEEGRA